jgi:hypothetical protein
MAASQKILSFSHWYSQCLFCSFIHYSHQCYLLSSILMFRLSLEAPVLCFLVVLLTVTYRLFGTWKKTEIIVGNVNKHVGLQCGVLKFADSSSASCLLLIIHLSMAVQPSVGPWPLFQFRTGRTPWTEDQPVARPLPTHRTTQTQSKRTQTFEP